MTRFRRLFTGAAVVAIAACGPALSDSARAQGADDTPQVPVTVTAITPVVRPGGQLDVAISVPTPASADELEVAFRMGPALNSRESFAQAAGGKVSSTAINFVTEPLVAGPATSTATLAWRVVGSGRNTSDQVVLTRAGVYPLTISVRHADDSEEISSTVTFVVRADTAAPRNPLVFSWVWPAYAEPPTTPGLEGSASQEAAAAELVRVMGTSLATTNLPVTLWPIPATIEAARAAGTDKLGPATSLEQLGQAMTGRDVVGGPFALVSTDAWSAMPEAADPQYAAARATLADALPSAHVNGTLAVAAGRRLAGSDLAFLANMGARSIVVDPEVADVNRKTTLTQRFRVDGVAEATFARADPGLRDDLADGGGAVAAAQRVLADLYILQLDAPGETHGAVLLPEAGWHPTTGLVSELVARLEVADFVLPMSLSAFFERVPVARSGREDLTLKAVSDESGPPPEALGQYAALSAARVHLDDLDSMLTPGATPAPQVLRDAERSYLQAPDMSLVTAGATLQYAAAVDAAYASVVDAIDVPSDVSITLTSATAPVPITLRNDNPFPVTVAVQLVPESAVSTEGRTSDIVTLEASRSHTEEFPVQTAGAGTFRVTVRVSPPNGGEVLSETHVELTATGGRWVAIALTIGSLLFLSLWWLWHARSSSRRGKHTRTRGEHPAGRNLPESGRRSPARPESETPPPQAAAEPSAAR